MSLDLKRAAFDGDILAGRSLVEAGADVHATGEHGSGTLLTCHPEVLTYLLSKGAVPSVQTNENGSSVLAGLCSVSRMPRAGPVEARVRSYKDGLRLTFFPRFARDGCAVAGETGMGGGAVR